MQRTTCRVLMTLALVCPGAVAAAGGLKAAPEPPTVGAAVPSAEDR